MRFSKIFFENLTARVAGKLAQALTGLPHHNGRDKAWAGVKPMERHHRTI